MNQPPILLVPKRYVDVPDDAVPSGTSRVPDIPPSCTAWGQVNDDLDTHSLPFSTKRPIIVARGYDLDDLRDWGAMPGNRMRRLDARGAQWRQDANDKQRGPAFRRAAKRKLAREAEAYARVEVVRRRRVDAVQNILLPIIGNIGMYGLCKALGVDERFVLAAPTNIVGLTGTITHWEDIAHADRQPPTLATGYQAMDGLAPIEGDGTWNSPTTDTTYACWNNSVAGNEGNGRIYNQNNGNSLAYYSLENTTLSTTRHFSRVRPWGTDCYRSFALCAYDHSTRTSETVVDCYKTGWTSATYFYTYRIVAGVSTTLSQVGPFGTNYDGSSYGEIEMSFDDSWIESYQENNLEWHGRDTALGSGVPGWGTQSNQGITEWGGGDLDAVPGGGGGGTASPGVGRVSLGRRGLRFS
jgi:hypothetical protein